MESPCELSDEELVRAIEAIATTLRYESDAYTRAVVRSANQPDHDQFRGLISTAKHNKLRVFARLQAQCDKLAGRGKATLALNLLTTAVNNADLAEQLAAVATLDTLLTEAA